MCFSAGASFAGGAIIAAAGIATIRRVRKPSQMLFASIPLLFSLQQFSEGAVWLTFRAGSNETLQYAATIVFLIMALLVWPVMMPLSALLMETLPGRKIYLYCLLAAGIILALYYSYCMITFETKPVIAGHHIKYTGDFPRSLRNIAFGIYLIATIPPLFISSVRRMWIMGVLIFFSVIITGIFYKEYLTSVWCFFAAMISIVIYYIITRPEEHSKLN